MWDEMFAGKLCIEVTPQSKIAFISESLCIGCGICIKVQGFCWHHPPLKVVFEYSVALLLTGRVCFAIEMSLFSFVNRQPAQQPGEGNHTQILCQFLQTAPVCC